MKTKTAEILAPAGTYEAFEAAIKAGADAVYAGGDMYSARAYAGNLSTDEFIRALDRAHLFDRKVYLTLNTLVKEGERGSEVKDFVRPLYRAGLDAVLIQDMGVYKILRDAFPDLPLHASTQLSISSSYGAALFKELGFERIVPARELTLDEIISIKNKVDIEIETFVHGAMCYAYSGKCLFSSFAGGRSGNRGRCAQPCRKIYELSVNNSLPLQGSNNNSLPLQGEHRSNNNSLPLQGEVSPQVTEGVKEHIMSLKDMCTIKELPYLIDAGIDSFKIEGRMKNPSYVASVTQAYTNARDLYLELKGDKSSFDDMGADAKEEYMSRTEKYMDDLKDIYNRGGFSTGYYFVDTDMLSTQRPNHTGLEIGEVEKISAPDVYIKLTHDVNKGDVFELIKEGEKSGVELTCNTKGKAGSMIVLKGKELKRLAPHMKVFRTRNETLLNRIKEEILDKELRVSAECEITACRQKPLKIKLTCKGITVEEEGAVVEEAKKAPLTPEVLIEKMKKNTGNGIEITDVKCDIDENVFVSMSAFNELRRRASEVLAEEAVARNHR